MSRRIALILPSSTYRARDFVRAARAAEAEIVIATEEEQLLADSSHLVMIDLDRPQWSADLLTDRGPYDAIIPVDDGGVMIAALAAAKLGLSHNPPDAVAATRDKATMRHRFARAGVPQPAYRVVDTGTDPMDAVAAVGLPAVVKPLGLSASQGVIRVDDGADVAATVDRVRAIASRAGAPDGRVLVEEYIAGYEVAVEAMLGDGDLVPLSVLDKPDPLVGPYFEETMFVTPTRHPEAVRDDLVAVVQQAATALGLVEGPVHAEARVGPKGVTLLEVAARPIGGLCSRALEFGVFGASLETVLVRHALRLPQSGLDPAAPASGVLMIPIPRSGRLAEVGGVDRAQEVDGITGIEITIPLGAKVRALPEGNRYLGFIFARGHSPAAVEQALRTAHNRLTVSITGPQPIGDLSSSADGNSEEGAGEEDRR